MTQLQTQLQLSSHLVPEHLQAIGEGIYAEMGRRFLFLLDFELMVNHDVGADNYCYFMLIFRKGTPHYKINDPGNKLAFALYADSIQAFVVGSPIPGANTITCHDYGDPDLFDNLSSTIEEFFNCHAHPSTG